MNPGAIYNALSILAAITTQKNPSLPIKSTQSTISE